MTGKDTINLFLKYVDEQGGKPLRSKVQVAAAEAQMKIYDLNNRTMGCHCECMGMMSDNMVSGMAGGTAKYTNDDFDKVCQRWGITNEKGEVII